MIDSWRSGRGVVRELFQVTDEPVTHAVDGEQMARPGRVNLELLPQGEHVRVDRAIRHVDIFSPHTFEERVSVERRAPLHRQTAKQREFFGGQVNKLAATMRDVPREVDRHVTKRQRVRRLAILHRVGSPHQRAHARKQFRDAERLGQVVVGAEIEPHHFVDLIAASRQHQDRKKLVAPADLSANFEAAQTGQHDVEDQNIRAAGGDPRKGLITSRDMIHCVPFEGQVLHETAGDGAIVFDDEDTGDGSTLHGRSNGK